MGKVWGLGSVLCGCQEFIVLCLSQTTLYYGLQVDLRKFTG